MIVPEMLKRIKSQIFEKDRTADKTKTDEMGVGRNSQPNPRSSRLNFFHRKPRKYQSSADLRSNFNLDMRNDLERLNSDLSRMSISLCEDEAAVSRRDLEQLQQSVTRVSCQIFGNVADVPPRAKSPRMSLSGFLPETNETRRAASVSSTAPLVQNPVPRRPTAPSFPVSEAASTANMPRRSMSSGALLRKLTRKGSGSGSSGATTKSKDSNGKTPPPSYSHLVKFTWKEIIDAVEKKGDLLCVCSGLSV